MRLRRLRRFFLVLVLYVLLLVPALIFDGYLSSPIGFVVLLPLIFVYLFARLGIPGLIDHGGACGWGWCSPTLFGWVFAAIVWLLLLWLIICLTTSRKR